MACGAVPGEQRPPQVRRPPQIRPSLSKEHLRTGPCADVDVFATGRSAAGRGGLGRSTARKDAPLAGVAGVDEALKRCVSLLRDAQGGSGSTHPGGGR
jgi:hypothetical protein